MQLRISIWSIDPDLPTGDDHPFWRAIEALGDLEGVGHLVNSDAPIWAHLSYLELPADRRRDTRLIAALAHLTAARRVQPQATFDIRLDDRPVPWDEQHGFTSPI